MVEIYFTEVVVGTMDGPSSCSYTVSIGSEFEGDVYKQIVSGGEEHVVPIPIEMVRANTNLMVTVVDDAMQSVLYREKIFMDTVFVHYIGTNGKISSLSELPMQATAMKSHSMQALMPYYQAMEQLVPVDALQCAFLVWMSIIVAMALILPCCHYLFIECMRGTGRRGKNKFAACTPPHRSPRDGSYSKYNSRLSRRSVGLTPLKIPETDVAVHTSASASRTSRHAWSRHAVQQQMESINPYSSTKTQSLAAKNFMALQEAIHSDNTVVSDDLMKELLFAGND